MRDILICHSPILTSVLLCEFLTEISEISNQDSTRCKKTILSLQKFCCNIQEATPDEKYIDFLMSQKDVKNRSIYKIAADNKIYTLLQSPEVGSIVKKNWEGNNIGEDIFQSSCLFSFVKQLHLKSPFSLSDDRDPYKSYSFQYESWKESCSLRFYPEMLSTGFLILIYNLYIFFLVNENLTEENFINLPFIIKFLLYIYAFWTLCIALNITNLAIFRILTNRNFKWDTLTTIECLIFIFAFSLFIDPQQYPVVEQLAIVEQLGLSYKFIIRAGLLTINDILVWLRIFGILLTFKEVGPFISMIYLFLSQMAKYIFLYFIFLLASCIIFLSLFYRSSDQFIDFSVGFTTLFGGFINNFNSFDFTQYQFFGAVLILLYVTLSGIILINFLIANLTNRYKKFSLSVNSSYRCILISYQMRYQWDSKFGFLVFLTTPFSILNSLALPIIYLYNKSYKSKIKICGFCCKIFKWKITKKPLKKFKKLKELSTNIQKLYFNNIHNNSNNNINNISNSYNNMQLNSEFDDENEFNPPSIKTLADSIARVYFSIFYLPFIIISYFFYLNLLVPLCYLKGLFVLLYLEFFRTDLLNFNNNFFSKVLNFFSWFLLGLPYLIVIVYNDIYFVIKTSFNPREDNFHKGLRIKQYLKASDIILFLTFIHQRLREENNDLHSIFMDYMKYENIKSRENDVYLEEKIKYKFKINASQKNFYKDKRKLAKVSVLVKKNKDIKNYINYSNPNTNSHSNLKYFNKKKPICRDSEIPVLNQDRKVKSHSDKEKEIENSLTLNSSDKKQKKLQKFSSSFVKKNIIIIEILENFLIDDGTDNCLVDIEKMQQLLPKTLIIDDEYITRLLNTNVNYIHKALTKLKNKKDDKSLKNKLTNKLVITVNNIDSQIDHYGKLENEERLKNKLHNDLIIYNDEKDENLLFVETEIRDIFGIIINDIKEQIKAFEENYEIIQEEVN